MDRLLYLDANPRGEDTNTLSRHDIPDGRLPEHNEFDEAFYYVPHQCPRWPESDGINIPRIPLGSPAFVEQYLHTKLEKHRLLLYFIEEVAKVGYSREAHKMLIGCAAPRLTHVLKFVPKDASSTSRMKTVDDAHLSNGMKCVGGETLHVALPPIERKYLANSLDLPP